MKKLINKISGGLAVMALPLMAAAVTVNPGDASTVIETRFQSLSSIFTLLGIITNWILAILIVLGVIFLVWAGIIYVTSGGEPEKVKTAKNYLIYAVVGIAIGLLAKAIVNIVQNFLITGGAV